MAYDKVVDSFALDDALCGIADAIREKAGTSGSLSFPAGMVTAIANIKTDPVLQSKTVSPSTSQQTVKPDSGYDGLSQVTVNAMPTATQATPSISVNSNGLITASATQTAGYVSAGTKSATKQLTTKAAATYTPGTSDQTIAYQQYLTGTQTIKGDANLIASNIKSGVSIFNVLGTFTGESGGGGGLPDGVSALASDTVTPAEDKTSTQEITHNLGVKPNFLVWWDTADLSSSVEPGVAALGVALEKQVKGGPTSGVVYNHFFSIHGFNSSGTLGQTGSRAVNASRMTATTAALVTTSTYPLKAGHTYRWVCGVMA